MTGVVSELRGLLAAWAGGAYPPFVYGSRRAAGFLPVFYFHAVQPEVFARQLRYLRDNDYGTVCADEAVQLLAGDHRETPARKVMLSFDDGLDNFHQVAFPLLKQFGCRAVLYLIPAWTGQAGFVTWEQVQAFHDSGLVDVQSHSHAHEQVIIDLKVRGQRAVAAERPPWGLPGVGAAAPARWPASVPVFAGDSLFRAREGWQLPAAFWSRPDPSVVARMARRLTAADLDWMMAADLQASRHAIESRLPGKTVSHLAFPWHLHGEAAWRALADCGFMSGAVGLGRPGQREWRKHGVLRLLRVNGDYLECLPGRGRRSFWSLTLDKARRRLRQR